MREIKKIIEGVREEQAKSSSQLRDLAVALVPFCNEGRFNAGDVKIILKKANGMTPNYSLRYKKKI